MRMRVASLVLCALALSCCIQQDGISTTSSTLVTSTTASSTTTTMVAGACSLDSNCVPAQCCHPTSCTDKGNAPDCLNVPCTKNCAGPIDCGRGWCACFAGRCGIQDLECSDDEDCARDDSRCADGVDPYHVCDGGVCRNLTFIADPCAMSHVCPKGSWDYSKNGVCIRRGQCPDSGCDDHSNATVDSCIDVGTDNEGCEYVVKGRDRCSSSSDCVPAQCCHPISCVNKVNEPDCSAVSCTAVCSGPLDCGAGRCVCIDGRCGIRSSGYGY